MNTGIHPLHGHYTPGGFAAFVIALVAAAAIWAIRNKLTRNLDDHKEIIKEKNTAYTIVRCLQVAGLAYGLSPVIGYVTDHWWQQALWALFDAVWVGVLFLVAAPFLNGVTKLAHSGRDALRGQSNTVALVLGMFYVAYGLVVGALLPGPGIGIRQMLAISVVFTALQVAYITVAYVVTTRPKRFVPQQSVATVEHPLNAPVSAQPQNLSQLLTKNNWAAAVLASTIMYVLGVISASAAAGAFTHWADSIITMLVADVIMLGLIAGGLWLLDKVVLTSETLREMIERNMVHAAGVMSAFIFFLGMCASWIVS